jgi:cytoskeletal protein RodZ
LSDELWVADPEAEHRRRALWGLLILALAAVIVVALMVFFIGSSGGHNSGLPNTSQIPELSSSAPASSSAHSATSSASSSSASRTPSTSASTQATTKCSSGNTCTLEGDAGHVIDAINAFRRTNGQATLPGTTTDAAKQCSLNSGGGDCPSSYFWEPVTPQDGSMVVQKIASRSDGRAFLLNPSMKSLQVGWAYLGGQYSCTVVGVF